MDKDRCATTAMDEPRLDVLRELVNIGVGRAAEMLNQITSAHIDLLVPEVMVCEPGCIPAIGNISPTEPIAAVKLCFSGVFSGTAALIFPPHSASLLVSILVGEEQGPEMDSLRIGALQEVGNIMLNGVMGSFANVLGEHLDYMPPDYYEDRLERLLSEEQAGCRVLLVRTNFVAEARRIEGDILIFFRLGSFDSLVASIDRLLAESNG